jgi:hypothetical protein
LQHFSDSFNASFNPIASESCIFISRHPPVSLAAAYATVSLFSALPLDVFLAQAQEASQSPAKQTLDPQKTAPRTDSKALNSLVQAAPAAQPSPSDPLLGDWRLTYLADNSSAVLKIERVARGIIGASLIGTYVTNDGRKCPLSGAIFQTIAGMYPDGAKIVTMDIAGMMRVAVQCDGRPTSIDAFLIDDQNKFSGAGRATTVQASPAKTTVSVIQLSH